MMFHSKFTKFFLLTAMTALCTHAYGADKRCKEKNLADFNISQASLQEKADFFTCFQDKGLHSVSIPALIDFVAASNNPDFQEKHLSRVLEDVPREYQHLLFKKLAGKKLHLSAETRSNLLYFYALYYFDRGSDKKAAYYLSKQIGVNFDRFGQSKFLMGVMYTKHGKFDEAEAEFSFLSSGKYKTPNNEIKKKIVNSSKLNLARLQIHQKNYEGAISHYRDVSYLDNKWFDGLVEMSWSMLSRADFEKAVGNASFVSKTTQPNIYKPWLDVIQGIGLLKLCQFPEAKAHINHFKENYSQSIEKVKGMADANKELSLYDFAAGLMDADLEKAQKKGVPELLFYVVRNSKIIEQQNLLNRLIDEERELEEIEKDLSRHNKRSYASNLTRRRLRSVKKYISSVESRIGKIFKKELYTILDEHAKLKRIAALVEFEILSRSSNSIQMRVAGAEFNDKKKKAGSKNSAWTYVGQEFWTDEVGKFESFVENKCVSDTHGMKKVSKK